MCSECTIGPSGCGDPIDATDHLSEGCRIWFCGGQIGCGEGRIVCEWCGHEFGGDVEAFEHGFDHAGGGECEVFGGACELHA